MAVSYQWLERSALFTGLSTDEKPNPVPVGSKFIETNTGDVYEYVGGDKIWMYVESIGVQSQLQGDASGLVAFNSIFGDRYVANRKPTISANFNYALDSRKIKKEELNGATVTKVDNLLTVNSGVLSNGSAYIQSKDSVRYTAGRDAEIMFTCRFDAPVAGNIRRIGLYDADDGMFIGYNNTTFGITVRRDGVDTFIPKDDWNLDKCDGNGKSGFNWDTLSLDIVRITYGYLGVASILFQVYGGIDKGWITFHAYEILNASAQTHIKNPYLAVRAENINNGNTTNVRVQSGSVYAGVIDGHGSGDSSSREFSRKISKTSVTSGTDVVFCIFHNKTTYQSVVNKINDLLLRIGVGVEGTKPVLFSLYRLVDTPTGTTFTDVSTLNSNMEVSTVGTVNLANAELLMSWALGKSDAVNDGVEDLNLVLRPDEYACFTYTSTGSADVQFTNRWSELF